MFFSEGWRQIVAQNTLSGATVDRIPLSKFPSFPIMVPSMRIMAAFDEIVRPMFAEIEVLGRKNQNLRATRDLLLPKLISGELDVSTLSEPTV
jgi:type I restriction enzyme S subunit